jgi:hypothetical protein
LSNIYVRKEWGNSGNETVKMKIANNRNKESVKEIEFLFKVYEKGKWPIENI